MELFEVFQRRRSIRRFEDRPVEKEKILRLLEAAFLAPSGRNIRPWHFVVITDRDIIRKLADAKSGARPLTTAPLAIVVAADEDTTDIWIEDSSIAADHIHLAATDLGLGSCWIQIRGRQNIQSDQTAEQYVRQLVGLPECFRITCIIAVGYPAEHKPPHDPRIEFDKVSLNHYGNPLD